MARSESKSIRVPTYKEQSTIKMHERFGWILLSSQEVLSSESHLERKHDKLQSVTTTNNYVKLVFQRDLDMPNIARIKQLEESYWNSCDIISDGPSILQGWILKLMIALTVFGVIMCAGGAVGAGIVCFALAIGVFCIRYFLFYMPKKKKRDEAAENIREVLRKVDDMGINT